MTERLDLFSTPVLKAIHPNAAVLNEALLAAIRKERSQSEGVSRSNTGGWHSDTTMTQWGGDAAKSLADFAIETSSGHLTDIHKDGKRSFQWACEMWANINPPGASNAQHCHPGAVWSGVYYVSPGGAEEASGGGELIFEDPRFPTAYMLTPDLVATYPDGRAMKAQDFIRPKAGLLVMFPGWLRHHVRPHKGSADRVSVAFNLMLHPA